MNVITMIVIGLLVLYAPVSLLFLFLAEVTKADSIRGTIAVISLWLATSAAYFGMTELTSNAPFPFWPAALIGGVPAYAAVVLMFVRIRDPHVHSWEVVSEEVWPEMEYIPQMNADYGGGDEYYPTGKQCYRRKYRCMICGDEDEIMS